MKEIAVYVITFNTFSKNGALQVSFNSFVTKKNAEREAKILRANGHANVKIAKTTLAL
jgi:hypothetical protein